MTGTGSQKYAFFQGKIVPFEEAKVGVLTHALNYGTGVFEGIRAYWNPDKEDLFLLLAREHYVRFLRNTRMVFIDVPYTVGRVGGLHVRTVSNARVSRGRLHPSARLQVVGDASASRWKVSPMILRSS